MFTGRPSARRAADRAPQSSDSRGTLLESRGTPLVHIKNPDVPSAPNRPRLCAATIVANECDVIESFVRHTLSFADHLYVLFHNSYDTSRRIVDQLAAEGLPITIDVATSTAFAREKIGDVLVRRIALSGRYDYLLPLDADEFIVTGSRAELERELGLVPEGGTLSLDWLAYVPTERDDATDPNPATRIRHRLRTPHPRLRKVFFAATLLARNDVYLADGNHKLLSRTGREIPERATSRVALAHYPVRSAPQLASKVCIGSMARRLSADFTDNQSLHWRSMMADPSLTTDTPIGILSQVSMRYLGCADSDLVDAPLTTPARSLRYAGLIRVNAFERLSAFITATLAEGEASDPSSAAERNWRKSLLKETEDARHTMQRLHEELRATKNRMRGKVRAAKRRARIRMIAAAVSVSLLAAAAIVHVLVR